jgi:hypothetical protein
MNTDLTPELPIVNRQGTDKEMIDLLLEETFFYFERYVNAKNGLIADKSEPNSASSIAAVGLGLSCYISVADRGLISREDAARRTLTVLKFFQSSKQGPEADATGYKGFYYHFLDMKSGKRAYNCELSTIDSAILIAGVLCAVNYFTQDNEIETQIRQIGNELYLRIDWQWALNEGKTISLGWKPESGFLPYRWEKGYSEAIILYVLAMGSPTFPIDPAGYKLWTDTFEWKKMYKIECIYAGPLFIHQMSHIWIDFKGIFDDQNRKFGIDYFENSRRATHLQQKYAIHNPNQFVHYGENGWGFTASNGPGPCKMKVNGEEKEFFGYIGRGAPFGPDDGTISPWAVVASLPFTPQIVLKTIRHAIERFNLKRFTQRGFDASFNPSFPSNGIDPKHWVYPWQLGLNQGPIILMIDNYQTGLIWKTMKQCSYLVQGLKRGGFEGGWLD